MSTSDSAITIYQQPTLQAHIYKPDAKGAAITKLRIKRCTINRGVSTITTAKLQCVQAYTTKLGGAVDNNYIVPNAADSDTLKGYYLMVCAPVTKSVKEKDGSAREKQDPVPLFVGIILGVSFSAHTGAAGTSSQLTIQCAAPLHKMMALKLGGGWYYARPLTETNASGILASQVQGLRLARMGSLTMSSTSVPSVISNALATRLKAKYKSESGMYTIFQIINQLYMLVATSIGNRLPEKSEPSDFDIQDADKLSSMLDSSHQVRAVTPASASVARPANGVEWAEIWYRQFQRQLMACLGSGDFGSILDMLIRDNFRMLDIVPVPLHQQQQAVYNKYDVKAALMRLVARSSILGAPQELTDISKLAIDNITYIADYKGLLQRPDQVVLCARPISTAKQEPKADGGGLNNDGGLYFIYPDDLKTAGASKVMRRAQIQTPDWLHWHYIRDIYGKQAEEAYMSEYAKMMYAQLYDTYGQLTLSGAVVDVKDIPFDKYLGKIIKLEKPDWTLPFMPADLQAKKGKIYYVGRVQQLILTYMSDAVDEGKSKLRYTATVRVVPSSVLPKGVKDGTQYIQNKLYTVPQKKPQ